MYYSIPVRYSVIIGIIAFFIELLLCVFRGEYYFRGWRKAEFSDIVFHIAVFCFLLFYYFKKIRKLPEFTKCPKCKKIYNFSDTKDMICPKCGGNLQDYAEFEKEQEKQDEFKEADKFQDEWIKQIKEENNKQ